MCTIKPRNSLPSFYLLRIFQQNCSKCNKLITLLIKRTESLIDIVGEGLMVYSKRKKKSAGLHNKGRHFRPQLISVLQVSLVH